MEMGDDMKLLIVEDDLAILDAMVKYLTKQEYEVISSSSIEEAMSCFNATINLLIIDIGLPDGSGLDLIKMIREMSLVPILVVSAYNEEHIIIESFDLGGDDYVTKPFNTDILLRRIRGLLQRQRMIQNNILTYRQLVINIKTQQVFKGHLALHLTPMQYEVLLLFIESQGKVLTRQMLLHRLWDHQGEFVEDNTLSVLIKRLKDKIGKDYITTIRQVGYRMEGEDE